MQHKKLLLMSVILLLSTAMTMVMLGRWSYCNDADDHNDMYEEWWKVTQSTKILLFGWLKLNTPVLMPWNIDVCDDYGTASVYFLSLTLFWRGLINSYRKVMMGRMAYEWHWLSGALQRCRVLRTGCGRHGQGETCGFVFVRRWTVDGAVVVDLCPHLYPIWIQPSPCSSRLIIDSRQMANCTSFENSHYSISRDYYSIW